MNKTIISFVFLLFFINSVKSEEQTLDISSLVTPIIQKYNMPSMSVAIVQGDTVIALGADGVRSKNQPVRVTVNDLYHLGSCTKSMTATLCAMLVEDGLLRWDMRVLEVFPELNGKIHTAYQSLTLRQLLTHTGGLPKDTDYGEIHQASPNDVRKARELALRKALSIAPAAASGQYFYSNLGYIIAGHMAERVTGSRWEDLIRHRLFSPLGMVSAGFGPPGNPAGIEQPFGHRANGTPLAPSLQADNPPVLGPAGTVHCTLRDWAKYVGMHTLAAQGNANLLSLNLFRDLHTPYPGNNYAMGWLIVPRAWGYGDVMTHSGTNTYWYSVVWMAPNRNFAVLVAVNQGGDAAAAACDEAAGKLILYFNSLKK